MNIACEQLNTQSAMPPSVLLHLVFAHRRNRKSGQATTDKANEPDVYLLVTVPFLGGDMKLSE
jgi:hypothetical protein